MSINPYLKFDEPNELTFEVEGLRFYMNSDDFSTEITDYQIKAPGYALNPQEDHFSVMANISKVNFPVFYNFRPDDSGIYSRSADGKKFMEYIQEQEGVETPYMLLEQPGIFIAYAPLLSKDVDLMNNFDKIPDGTALEMGFAFADQKTIDDFIAKYK